MKQIINRRKYDTETATFIDNYYSGGCGDFSHVNESLYKKKTGEFFLAGSGGAMSKYSVMIDSHNFEGGSRIIPLTEDEAKDWVEKYSDADTYIKTFGEPEE